MQNTWKYMILVHFKMYFVQNLSCKDAVKCLLFLKTIIPISILVFIN